MLNALKLGFDLYPLLYPVTYIASFTDLTNLCRVFCFSSVSQELLGLEL